MAVAVHHTVAFAVDAHVASSAPPLASSLDCDVSRHLQACGRQRLHLQLLGSRGPFYVQHTHQQHHRLQLQGSRAPLQRGVEERVVEQSQGFVGYHNSWNWLHIVEEGIGFGEDIVPEADIVLERSTVLKVGIVLEADTGFEEGIVLEQGIVLEEDTVPEKNIRCLVLGPGLEHNKEADSGSCCLV